MITTTRAKPTAAPREKVRMTAPEARIGDGVGGQPEEPSALAPRLEQRERDEHEHDLGVAVLLADRAGQAGEALDRDAQVVGGVGLGEPEVVVGIRPGGGLVDRQATEEGPDDQEGPDHVAHASTGCGRR